MSSGVPPARKKRRRSALWQLLIAAALLAVIWLSFGQNVLAPARQSKAPEQLGVLELVSTVEGPEAMSQVNRLHGVNINLVDAYIAEYAHGNERASAWVGRAESSHHAAELIQRMFQGIKDGNSTFGSPQQLSISGHDVFQVDGPGGQHFFYNSVKSGENVVWLTIEADDALSIVETALKSF
ncbi:MAG: hypothetical protein HY530_02530 [Chloroflexi bacterium]|nr:hypothetical protein [Chloroflexota bacterium]